MMLLIFENTINLVLDPFKALIVVGLMRFDLDDAAGEILVIVRIPDPARHDETGGGKEQRKQPLMGFWGHFI